MDVLAHLGLEVGLGAREAPLGVFEFLSYRVRTDRVVISSNRLAVRWRRAGNEGTEEPVLGRLGLAVGHGPFEREPIQCTC